MFSKYSSKQIYLEKPCSQNFVKWISRKKLMITLEKHVGFFWFNSKKKNTINKLKYRNINCFSLIIFADFIKKKKMLLYSNSESNLILKILSLKNFFLNFFFNFQLSYFRKDFYKQEILYIISNKKKNKFSYKNKLAFDFSIFNIEEGKLLKVLTFDYFLPCEKLFHIIEKSKTIIVAIKNIINFFIINWTCKKIKKIKMKHVSEIYCLDHCSNSLIVADKNGCIFLFEKNEIKKKNPKLKESSSSYKFFFFVKKKINFFQTAIQCLTLKKNKTILFNFSQKLESINFDFDRKKKKFVFFLKSKSKSNIFRSHYSGNNQFLIHTSDDIFFLIKKKIRFNVFGKSNISSMIFFNEIDSLCNIKNFKAFFFPIIFPQNFFFVILGFSNLFQIFDFHQNKLIKKYFNFYKNLKIEKKFNVKRFNLEQNFTGKSLFISYNSTILKFFINSNCFEEIYEFLFKIQKKKKKNIMNKKLSTRRSFGENGGKLAFFYSDGIIKIWNTSPFFLKHSEKLFKFSRKKITSICLSKDGLYLAASFSKTLVIWKSSGNFEKLKVSTLDFETDVCTLKFISYNDKSYFLVSSKKEIAFWDLKRCSVIFIFKIKNLIIYLDQWSDQYLILTKIFRPKFFATNQCFAIFKKDSPIPFVIIDPIFMVRSNIISTCFSYFRKKQNNRSILIIDTFLKIHKIFY